jgi:hypothetical protein
MQQDLIIALTIVLAIAVARLVSVRRTQFRYMEDTEAFKTDLTRRRQAAKATARQDHGVSGHEPLLRFYDQEVRTRNSGGARGRAAARPLSFLIRQTEGSHFECYVIRSSR